MEELKLSVSKRRKILIGMFYKFLLVKYSEEKMLEEIEQETNIILDQESADIAKEVCKNKDEIIKMIEEKLNEKWNLSRIPFLVQSVLLIGVYEIRFTTTPKAVTINEMVKFVKDYIPEFDFKFVNALLDKIIKL